MTDTNATEATTDTAAEEKPKAPFFTVVKGNPTPAEAATLAVLFAGMANAAANADTDKGPRNDWGALGSGFQNNTRSYNPAVFRNVAYY
ncbi:acyl-CoA carboxylase subunit epsilon [Corynebacterium sp. H113]|uniref:acyl-CoA carboxylase subunit epsilon n=1 Tax=Corynebacterium sp. H113 TaxID=3133419 RepID=UPI00309EC537